MHEDRVNELGRLEREARRQIRRLRKEAQTRVREHFEGPREDARGAARHRRHAARLQREASRPRKKRKRTPEEKAYREARRRANAKLSFMIHLVPYTSVCLFLLLVAGFRAAFIVALAWGIGLSIHGFVVLIAPDLRRRWIDDEVRHQLGTTVSSERQALEGKHARNLEELSASLAHEIRNPITAAKSLVQQLGEDPRSADNVEYAKVALDELDRVERSISHLLRFAREEELALAEMRMAETVDSALGTIQERIERLHVEVEREFDAAGTMLGDPDKLRRVLINLFNNALDALEESGRSDPRIELVTGENLAGTEVWVRVRDNGNGIEPDQIENIFSPFYTSKQTGTGLGLAISKKLVDAHGGTIEAHSSPEEGTEFLLTFPKQRPTTAPA